VGASGCAAVGVVTELMDVHATLGIRIVSGDIPSDGSWGGFGGLLESDGSGDLGVTSDGCNWRKRKQSARIFRTRHDNSPVSTTRGRQVKGPAKMEAELSLGVAIRVTLLIARWRSNPAHIVSSDPAILPSTPKTTARPGSREISMHDIPALTILALFVVFVNELDVDVKFMCEVVGIK